jgi:translation initiation factor IF-2
VLVSECGVAKQLRVHILARELDVDSKDILAKCRAEGIVLTGHMAAVSVGLAESIREWFSTGADITSVEEAAPVDLAKVRKPRRRSKEAKGAAEEESAVATLVVEPVAPPDAEPRPMVAEAAPAEILVAPEGPAPTPTPVDAAPVRLVEPPAEEEAPPERAVAAAEVETPPGAGEAPPPLAPDPDLEARPAAVHRPEPAPPRRAPIRPAGPQVVPRPAALQGPRVVRIESPEPLRAPRPRPGPAPPMVATASPAAAPDARGRTRRVGEEDKDSAKSRSRSPRRHGGTAEVVERVREWRDQDLLDRKERLASATGHGLRDRRAAERRRQLSTAAAAVHPGRKATVEIVAPILLKNFCEAVSTKFNVIYAKLLEHTGKLYTLNQTIDADTAELLALDLGVALKIVKAKTALEKLEEEFTIRERPHLQRRPPVVAMLGHVDHGKTSLLDAIRNTQVAAGEAGGITQRIGAYRIDRGNWHVTFLDTPGHEAFTAMRARGADLTDVVVLVVAADDGVMPQTVEALNHARAAGVQIVVALNKIDLPHDINRLYAQLSEHDLAPSEWGGNTDVIKTSAAKGIGIDELIAHLSTLSDLLDLQADPTVPARATVIEAQMREGRGAVAQVLVREGTLLPGQIVVCGASAGRIRVLTDDAGARVQEAGPGTPVEVGGLDELPRAGDTLYVVDDLTRAKEIAAEVRQRRREESLQTLRKPQTLEDLLRGGEEGEVRELPVVIKADGQASVDALRTKLGEFPADKARLRVLHAAVGAVSEADVVLAQTTGAAIFGFNVVSEDRARQLADQVGVQIRQYRVIYEMLDDIQKALEGLLEPLRREETRGKAEVRQVFNISRVGTVAGCMVVDGAIARSHKLRLVRDGRIVLEGAAVGSLRRVKDDAREVRAGLECGIKLEGFDDVKPGDVIEAYEIVEVAQRL